MTFKKLYIKKIGAGVFKPSSCYQISLTPGDGYEIYFTDEKGEKMVTSEMLKKPVNFTELPTPLLKQIK